MHLKMFSAMCQPFCGGLSVLTEVHSQTLPDVVGAIYNMIQHKQILTHWGRVTHICVNKLTIIGSDNGLAPGRRQTIIWTNDGILLIGTLGTNFSEILIGIQTFSFKKMHLKMSSAKWRPFCLSLYVLNAAIQCLIWNISSWTHKRHTIPQPYRSGMECLLVFWNKIGFILTAPPSTSHPSPPTLGALVIIIYCLLM